MSFSIIIPTAFDKREWLQKCLESIQKYTDLSDSEIIVVCNGCTDDSAEYVRNQGFVAIESREALGYAKAVNVGIRAAKGEFIVLLNNDTELLPQENNEWIHMLYAPFSDPQVAITGPWMSRNTEIDREFLIFFCCMIRKSILDKVGMLDAIFGPGYGEDVDLCCRVVDKGYKILQVPVQDKLPYDGKQAIGQFPIWHAANKTLVNWPDGDKLLHKNHGILRERYDGVFIGNAQKLGEWVSDSELRWLARQAKKSKVVVELGSWHGKSARAMADNLPGDGVLWCIDHWKGSKAEPGNVEAASQMDGDQAYDTFCRNLKDHIITGKVRTIRMNGGNGAKLLRDIGVIADFIFLDAGHTYQEVQEDTHSLLPLRKRGGIISGHDYMQQMWPEVTPAVLDTFGRNVGQVPDTTIWATDAPPLPTKPNIYDCFLFNNELDMLEYRFKKLYDVVDRFVITEAPITFGGHPKELVFHNNLVRFEKYLSKVTYIVVEDLPKFNGTEDSAWAMEQFQRESIMRGLNDAKPNDIIISGDVDEIPTVEAIKSFDGDIASFEMDLYVYDYSVKAVDPWIHCKIARLWKLKELGVCYARYNCHDTIFPPRIKNGGEHLSYFGGIDSIIEKIGNTPHRNIDLPKFKTREHIQKCIDEGLDLYGRDDIKYVKTHG